MKLLKAVNIVSTQASTAIHFAAANFFSKYAAWLTETVRNNANVMVSLGSHDQ